MKIYLLLILCTLFVSVFSLSCKCGKCKKPDCKNGVGLVKDPCNCCDVCAKQETQKCGGPWNLAGRCDKGLACVVRKQGIVVKRSGMSVRPGHCEPAACAALSCPKYYTCKAVNKKAVCECPRHCKKTGRKVCGLTTGKEYDNECELKKYECKTNQKIPFKHGPCKRCVKDGQRYKFGEQVKSGPCEICSCAHGEWRCKNTYCVNQNTKNHGVPLLAQAGAPCDANSDIITCAPGLRCDPLPMVHYGSSRPGVCVRKADPSNKCPTLTNCQKCKYGYIVDNNGCKTCECKPKKNICRLPKNPGQPCGHTKGQVRRFYFDFKVGKCKPFIFLGCLHNSNNFKTKKACEAKCLV